MDKTQQAVDRRNFMGALGAAGAMGLAFTGLGSGKLEAAEPGSGPQDVREFLDQAPDGEPLRAGLVGCGGRGRGAVRDFLQAGPNLQITALADVIEERLKGYQRKLKKENGIDIPDDRCFLGFDAYQKLIDSDVDMVMLATPPHFRPEHFAACINARKHVFMEKPVAVDPVGVRSVMATARKAEAVGLCVVTGTQRRHSRNYASVLYQIRNGVIGDIVSANCYWNGGQLWYRERQDDWSDMEYMIRDWVNWCWLSGDHIVEQHIHNIDVINWFTGMHPVRAVGFGGRHRRPTGDQFDFFSVDFEYENKMHVHSMCRQINGCGTNVSEIVFGTKGYTNCTDTIWDWSGKVIWERNPAKLSPYVQEHIDLVTAIRTEKPIVEAEATAVSNLTAIMGRISAYTGKPVTYEEMMQSDLRLGPTEYAMGPLDIKAVIPVPGV